MIRNLAFVIPWIVATGACAQAHLWEAHNDGVYAALNQGAYGKADAFTHSCKTSGIGSNLQIQICSTDADMEKTRVYTREINGSLEATSIVAPPSADANILATMVDVLFANYLTGKMDYEKILPISRATTQKILVAVAGQRNVSFSYPYLRVHAYFDKIDQLHVDFERQK